MDKGRERFPAGRLSDYGALLMSQGILYTRAFSIPSPPRDSGWVPALGGYVPDGLNLPPGPSPTCASLRQLSARLTGYG